MAWRPLIAGAPARLIELARWVRGHRYFALLVALALLAMGVSAFIEIAEEVTEGETQRFDEWAVRALRRSNDPAMPIGPRWLHEAGRDITALGGTAVLSMATLAVAGYLLMVAKRKAMWLVLIATAGGLMLNSLLKAQFARDRPSIVPHLSYVQTSSFPSGHSMLSAVVYLTLGTLLARLVPNRIAKTYFVAIAVMLSVLIGVSRVYMGVHYPTDVLAGWTAGLVWACLCWVAARWLQIHGTVEKDVDEPGGAQAAAATQPPGTAPPPSPQPTGIPISHRAG